MAAGGLLTHAYGTGADGEPSTAHCVMREDSRDPKTEKMMAIAITRGYPPIPPHGKHG